MWVAFLTSYLKDYWPCLVLGASLVYYLDVPDLRACCSEESWVHHVGLGSYFVTSQMAFLVHLEGIPGILSGPDDGIFSPPGFIDGPFGGIPGPPAGIPGPPGGIPGIIEPILGIPGPPGDIGKCEPP